jgi:hypothetical protein
MANIMDEFPSKYLKAEDVEDEHPTVTITHITREEVGKERDRKPVIFFKEFDKGVVLNKTNATNISKMYGSDTDNWPGKTVVLGTAMVDFNGESKPAIRIWPPKRQAGQQQPQAATRMGSVNAPLDNGQRPFAPPADDLDSDIPF